jgi:hypothetical protein
MERRCAFLVFGACVALAISGCGQQAGSPASTSEAAAANGATAAQGGPDKAVHDFLDAVRRGDDAKAAKMLTPVAREKTAELHMVVAPPGSETAQFEVGEVEMVSEDGAHVATTWTDVDAEGNRHSDQILWILRKEKEGWRVAGMATKIFDDELPIILNFEDPQDMLRKQKLAEEEVARRADRDATQARSVKPAEDEKPR